MADFEDAGHRPHGTHYGEEPRNPITYGPESISVTLDTWGPQENLFPTLYDMLQSNWGDAPSRSVNEPCEDEPFHDSMKNSPQWKHVTGWCRLTPGQRAYVERAFSGGTLQQALELITFSFTIDGVTRAFTHQNVRTRLGAAFMQHGGRDNDWRHRPWTMPETIGRMCEFDTLYREMKDLGMRREGRPMLPDGREHCVKDWNVVDAYVQKFAQDRGLPEGVEPHIDEIIEAYLNDGRRLYSMLVDAGIPWQDARRVLWIGTQTYIHDVYNYLALRGVLSNRLELIMDWEHVCVAQLMLREVRMKCPPILGKYLMSASDRAKKAAYAGLESWPPDGKYPNPHERCADCGHAKANHVKRERARTVYDAPHEEITVCEVCERSDDKNLPGSWHDYIPHDTLPRTHTRLQNPFWVLAPESLAGGPIRWIATNGEYPHDQLKEAK